MASAMTESERDALYADRNNAVQLAAVLAAKLGLKSGVRVDPEHLAWPVVVIELPGGLGQVAWHIPEAELVWPHTVCQLPYDGHTNEEKADRIRAYCCTQSP